MAAAIQRYFPSPGSVIAFVGAGHNGGDALVVARLLAESWIGRSSCGRPSSWASFRPLTAKKLEEVGELGTEWDPDTGLLPDDPRPVLLLDGLAGHRGEVGRSVPDTGRRRRR